MPELQKHGRQQRRILSELRHSHRGCPRGSRSSRAGSAFPARLCSAPVPEKRGAHGCSIAGFVCGLLGLIFCWTYIGLLAIPGLILSIVGMSQKNRSKGLGIAGLILSAIALCIWLIVLAAIGIAVL